MAALALIQNILRSPDEVKAVLEAALVDPSGTSGNDAQSRRVLAVVSHRDDWDLTEEGSLFVCKYKPGPNGQSEELDVHRVYAIYGDFSIVISQMRRGTIDLQTTSPRKSMLEQSGSVMGLSINAAEGLADDAQPPSFFTPDVEGCRSQFSDQPSSSTTHFNWLRPYFAKYMTIASLTNTPQDLRLVNKPLLERLSPASAGFMSDDQSDAQLIRDDWTEVGTFNVNGKMPSQDLSAWVQPAYAPPVKNVSPISLVEVARNPFDWILRRPNAAAEPEKEEPDETPLRVDTDDLDNPDMLVLGFQELDLSTEALIYSTNTVREDAWSLAVFASLGEKAVKYEKLASKQLVGMLILMIVKKSLKPYFGDVKTTAAGAGILGVMGNKGGTAIRVSFTPPVPTEGKKKVIVSSPGPTILTFVNAHLAAFDEMVDKRNSDFFDLSRRLTFENTLSPLSSPTRETEDPFTAGFSSVPTGIIPLSIYETDALFWMFGMSDLNYRLDLSEVHVRRILRDDEWQDASKFEALLRFDQLRNAMLEKKAFEDFKEAPIIHMPSYRFSPGLMMDKFGYDLKRKPAWTDRILHMHGSDCRVNQISYTSHPQIVMSDHRPVAADFNLDLDLYDLDLFRSHVHTLFHEVDHLDGESTHDRGGLKVEDTYVDFEKVFYDVPVERKIRVRNTGKGPRAFRFVPIQLDSPIHPEWLQIYPMMGVILPNEVTEISLRAHIDNDVASILNLRPSDLSGTLILHTVLGKDHFISVSGEYQYTCFANKLTRLTRLRGPIRSMESPNDLLPEVNAVNAPREVMRLVNWMMSSPANKDELFVIRGAQGIIRIIRECLDTGDEFPYAPSTPDPQISLAFASALLLFLDSLGDPIIPAVLHPQCLEMTNRDEAFELLDALMPAAVNVWISITAFLHFICQSSENEDQAERISTIFAPVLLRDDPKLAIPPVPPHGKRKFLLYFIG
ncbi:Endonuclease/exonuclease/phosphatase [Gymnopilus junonius]|uniref:Endonuclease/exonuclease/phosphatase n=1 Tax=Gymnopilus junonius TaxID=109634 RepID=A0A9P5TSL4_GYMJU|nr:Endonuclease/exonuclease/phosphatase [Gymnopilus junonius]